MAPQRAGCARVASRRDDMHAGVGVGTTTRRPDGARWLCSAAVRRSVVRRASTGAPCAASHDRVTRPLRMATRTGLRPAVRRAAAVSSVQALPRLPMRTPSPTRDAALYGVSSSGAGVSVGVGYAHHQRGGAAQPRARSRNAFAYSDGDDDGDYAAAGGSGSTLSQAGHMRGYADSGNGARGAARSLAAAGAPFSLIDAFTVLQWRRRQRCVRRGDAAHAHTLTHAHRHTHSLTHSLTRTHAHTHVHRYDERPSEPAHLVCRRPWTELDLAGLFDRFAVVAQYYRAHLNTPPELLGVLHRVGIALNGSVQYVRVRGACALTRACASPRAVGCAPPQQDAQRCACVRSLCVCVCVCVCVRALRCTCLWVCVTM
jgi:hypothetical protein